MRAHRLVLTGLIGLASLALTACGFSPLYSSAGYDRLGGLRVEAGPERFDYLLQNAVRDFAGPGDSIYVLDIATGVSDSSAGVSPTGEATRRTLTGTASYDLVGAQPPLTGRTAATISFDQPRDPYAQIAALTEAEQRLAERLAEEVLQDIAVELRRREAGLTR